MKLSSEVTGYRKSYQSLPVYQGLDLGEDRKADISHPPVSVSHPDIMGGGRSKGRGKLLLCDFMMLLFLYSFLLLLLS